MFLAEYGRSGKLALRRLDITAQVVAAGGVIYAMWTIASRLAAWQLMG